MSKQFVKHKDEIETGLTEEDELYRENILDHYKNPHNKGKLKKFSIEHHELNPTCGDELTVYLEVKDNKIVNISFEGQGCAISIASASMLTDSIKGKSISHVKKMTKEDVYKLLGIPISVPRIRCALLSLKTIQNGLK